MYSVGEPVEYDLYVVDPFGNPLVDLEPTVTGNGPQGEFGFHVTQVGGGHYRVYSNVMEIDGLYTATVFTHDPWDQSFNLTWDVDPAPDTPGPVYLSVGSRTTLSTLRAMIARQMQDYRKLTATSGSPSAQIIDEFELVENTDHFRGAEVICIKGNRLNVGQRRKVQRSSYENAMLELTRPFPAAIVAGDQFEIFNFGRTRFHISEYDNAINDAIKSAWPQNREQLYVLPLTTYSRTAGIPIPDDLTHVYGVEVDHGDLGWIGIIPGRGINDTGWWVDRGTRILWIRGGYGWDSHEKNVRIYGYGRPAELVNDTDTTATDVEWLLDTASGSLLTSGLDQSTFPIGQSRTNRADQLRAKMARPSEPNTVSLE